MKLRNITGRAGAGKSKLVLETIAAQRFERPQILLVPEHATHEAELDLCRALGDTASRDAEVLSFQSLATRVLSLTGGIADITLDNGGKILTMRRALQDVSSFLTVFARPSQRPAFLRELVALADELYAYRIPPALLLQQVRDIPGAAGDKLRSTALLFSAYDARLHSGDFDARSTLRAADERAGSFVLRLRCDMLSVHKALLVRRSVPWIYIAPARFAWFAHANLHAGREIAEAHFSMLIRHKQWPAV